MDVTTRTEPTADAVAATRGVDAAERREQIASELTGAANQPGW